MKCCEAEVELEKWVAIEVKKKRKKERRKSLGIIYFQGQRVSLEPRIVFLKKSTEEKSRIVVVSHLLLSFNTTIVVDLKYGKRLECHCL